MLKKLLIIITTITTLSSCGFKLRGNSNSNLSEISVATFDDYSLFFKIFEEHLKNRKININEKSNIKLHVLRHSFTERVLAYGPDGKTNRASITLNIDYTVQRNPQPKKQYSMFATRDLSINPNSILGEQYRISLIKEELYKDISSKLIKKIQLINDANLS